MIKSMTAFAAAEHSVDDLTVKTEIRSYNSRHLDIFLRVPPACQPLEDKIKGLVSDRVARGRIEIRLQLDDRSDEAQTLEIDFSRAKALFAVFKELKSQFEFQNDITLEMLLGSGGIIKPVDKVENEDAIWRAANNCLQFALDDLDAMRKKEGDFIAKDLEQRINFIKASLKKVRNKSNGLLTQYQERLKERVALLTQDIVELDPTRVAQEAAFLADRSDISEEIVRAESHLEQFDRIMNTLEPGGKKLNFLLQELNREFNTMASKIGNAEVAYLIIDVKSELEKIREQIQNIE